MLRPHRLRPDERTTAEAGKRLHCVAECPASPENVQLSPEIDLNPEPGLSQYLRFAEEAQEVSL